MNNTFAKKGGVRPLRPSRSPRLADLPAPSREQEALVSWLLEEKGHAVIHAVAGSGKTTTLRMLSAYAKGAGLEKMLYLAFNRTLAESMGSKLPASARVTTIHAFALHALRVHLDRFDEGILDERKYTKILRAWRGDGDHPFGKSLIGLEQNLLRFEKLPDTLPHRRRAYRTIEGKILSLWHFARITLTPIDVASLCEMIRRYELELWKWEAEAYFPFLRVFAAEGKARMRESLDFDDMLYFAASEEVAIPHRYDLVLVDEAQDLSNAQRAIVLRSVAPQGRLVAVGDPRQAIYLFAGANAASFEAIQSELQAKEFSLPTCYRCPPNHLELVHSIVPQIRAVEGRLPGEIRRQASVGEMVGQVQAGDLIVCRLVAPLVEALFLLLQRGIAARLRGRDVASQLMAVLETLAVWVAEEGKTWEEGRERALGRWLALKEESCRKELRLLAEEEHPRLLALQDKAHTLRAFFQSTKTTTATALVNEMDLLFADEAAAVWLSSVHRAKGLEAERVFVLYPGLLPLSCQGEEQERQEWNLRYVALTRAKSSLFLVGNKPPFFEKKR